MASFSLVFTTCSFIVCSSQFTISPLTLPYKMYYHFAGIYKDTMTVFGGQDVNNQYYESVSIFPELTEWKSHDDVALPSLSSEIGQYGQTGVQIGPKVWIINPDLGGAPVNDGHQLLIYDLEMHQYTIGPQPTYRAFELCTVYNPSNNIIYAIGGTVGGGDYKHFTQRFDISSNTWITPGADINIPRDRTGCSLDATNSVIYLFGGYDENDLDVIERYSVSDNKWEIINTKLTIPRYDVVCKLLATDMNIYCMGGFNFHDLSLPLDVVDVFSPIIESIIKTIKLNVRRTRFTASLWNDNKCIIVAGGLGGISGANSLDSIETIGDCPKQCVYEYNNGGETNSWYGANSICDGNLAIITTADDMKCALAKIKAAGGSSAWIGLQSLHSGDDKGVFTYQGGSCTEAIKNTRFGKYGQCVASEFWNYNGRPRCPHIDSNEDGSRCVHLLSNPIGKMDNTVKCSLPSPISGALCNSPSR